MAVGESAKVVNDVTYGALSAARVGVLGHAVKKRGKYSWSKVKIKTFGFLE